MAEKSLRTGRNTSLEPMNPYERRIIHTAVQTVEGAKSWSEGEDAARHVVIGPIAGERLPQRGRRGGPRGNRPPYRPGPKNDASGSRQPYPPGRQAAPAVPRAGRNDGPTLYGKYEMKK